MATYEDYQNNRFFRLGGKLWNIIVLSGLFVLCCLPVVTIGASLAALYYGVSKCFGKGSDRPAREFWHSFRDNLGQGSLLTIIYIVFCGLTVFDIIASYRGISGVTLPEGYRMFALLLILPVVFTVFYIFPYISRYSAGTGLALRNSFMLSASNIGHLLVLILITAAALAGSVFFPPAALVLPGLGALLSSKLIERDFSGAEQLAEMISSSTEKIPSFDQESASGDAEEDTENTTEDESPDAQ